MKPSQATYGTQLDKILEASREEDESSFINEVMKFGTDDDIDTSDKKAGAEKARILLVDDNQYNIVAIETMLQQFQLATETALDGTQAVAMVAQLFRDKRAMYDLILMDYTMPVMNGIDATKAIRKFYKEEAKG